ncbi:outer membrane protein [Sedimentitalea nanhaiensis]|uniref:Outer membrane autotransporter barrel domain-containing protein n=1 Tax=Sedimentitalea nanhaiensis TaxID=999627 RepID=A0A1I7EAL9_9RHOB|nr:outer membrane beta-barrel protein [Sedimentitalea nanhaiensis]SFU20984.1 outer membrane autotransporter barrel domain-containing protein [Sedimentitalea nanhaiensis]
MIKTTALAMALSAAASTAFAGNAAPAPIEPVVLTPVEQPFWAGAYVGGQLGYAFSDFNIDSNTLSDFDEDNVIGGITAGYLWALGNGWYLGPEFQYDFTDISVTDAATGDTTSLDAVARLKLIAGYELGNGLLYGSAGFAYADFDSVSSVLDFDSNSYVVGLGYDWRVGENWTVGAEYMYQTFSGAGSTGGDVDLNSIYLKATYRF